MNEREKNILNWLKSGRENPHSPATVRVHGGDRAGREALIARLHSRPQSKPVPVSAR